MTGRSQRITEKFASLSVPLPDNDIHGHQTDSNNSSDLSLQPNDFSKPSHTDQLRQTDTHIQQSPRTTLSAVERHDVRDVLLYQPTKDGGVDSFHHARTEFRDHNDSHHDAHPRPSEAHCSPALTTAQPKHSSQTNPDQFSQPDTLQAGKAVRKDCHEESFQDLNSATNKRLQPLNEHLHHCVPLLLEKVNGHLIGPRSDSRREGTGNRVQGCVAGEVRIIEILTPLRTEHPELLSELTDYITTELNRHQQFHLANQTHRLTIAHIPSNTAHIIESYLFRHPLNKKTVSRIREFAVLALHLIADNRLHHFSTLLSPQQTLFATQSPTFPPAIQRPSLLPTPDLMHTNELMTENFPDDTKVPDDALFEYDDFDADNDIDMDNDIDTDDFDEHDDFE